MTEEQIQDRWNTLATFVKEVCDGRDESHGYEHMKTVAETSRQIVSEDFGPNDTTLLLDVITVAWLHDVADHKYDQDGKLTATLDEFGLKHIPNFSDIQKVIKLVSFSSENKAILAGKPLDYDDILGEHYTNIRHIVSDADKLEAIGAIGVVRAIQYTTHANPGSTEEQIIEDVKKHAEEKLLRLAGEFIRTPYGKREARVRHDEMVRQLADL